jgi:hypothetical protein
MAVIFFDGDQTLWDYRPATLARGGGPRGVARQVAAHLGLSNLGSHGQLISR